MARRRTASGRRSGPHRATLDQPAASLAPDAHTRAYTLHQRRWKKPRGPSSPRKIDGGARDGKDGQIPAKTRAGAAWGVGEHVSGDLAQPWAGGIDRGRLDGGRSLSEAMNGRRRTQEEDDGELAPAAMLSARERLKWVTGGVVRPSVLGIG